MSDRNGVTIAAGDAVIFWSNPDDEDATSATVLADLGDGRYRIQLDRREPRRELPPHLQAAADQFDARLGDLPGPLPDVQEPFDVDGSSLEFIDWADWDDDRPEDDT